jgi:hypothetical protein
LFFIFALANALDYEKPRWPGRPTAPWVPVAPGLPFGHRCFLKITNKEKVFRKLDMKSK